jgi:hypothetical protein
MCTPHFTTHSHWPIDQLQLASMFASPRATLPLVVGTPLAQRGNLPIPVEARLVCCAMGSSRLALRHQ